MRQVPIESLGEAIKQMRIYSFSLQDPTSQNNDLRRADHHDIRAKYSQIIPNNLPNLIIISQSMYLFLIDPPSFRNRDIIHDSLYKPYF